MGLNDAMLFTFETTWKAGGLRIALDGGNFDPRCQEPALEMLQLYATFFAMGLTPEHTGFCNVGDYFSTIVVSIVSAGGNDRAGVDRIANLKIRCCEAGKELAH